MTLWPLQTRLVRGHSAHLHGEERVGGAGRQWDHLQLRVGCLFRDLWWGVPGGCPLSCHSQDNIWPGSLLQKHYLTGKARIKPVQIMEQSWCDERLNRIEIINSVKKIILHRLASLRYGLEKKGQTNGFWVFPLVFCVALNETYKTRFYRESGSGSYREEGMSRKLMKKLGRDDSYFIRATGSCKGRFSIDCLLDPLCTKYTPRRFWRTSVWDGWREVHRHRHHQPWHRAHW